MKPHKLNQLALWLPMHQDGLLVKVYNAGYPYTKGRIIMQSSATNPVYRYVKNYKVGVKKYSLCLISQEADQERMEAWLDKQAKQIRVDDLDATFKMTGVEYK